MHGLEQITPDQTVPSGVYSRDRAKMRRVVKKRKKIEERDVSGFCLFYMDGNVAKRPYKGYMDGR